ncbi:MAG: hypothetical protein ACRD50_13770 [Candidatus Acidiferrales bacterium]
MHAHLSARNLVLPIAFCFLTTCLIFASQAPQTASPTDSAQALEDQKVREINRAFLEAWLVRGDTSLASQNFSSQHRLPIDALQNLEELTGHKYLRDWDRADQAKYHAALIRMLTDLRNLFIRGRHLADILAFPPPSETDHREEGVRTGDLVVNDFQADRFELYRLQDLPQARKMAPGSQNSQAPSAATSGSSEDRKEWSAQELAEFAEHLPELNHRRPDDVFYLSQICGRLKGIDAMACGYFFWNKDGADWKIIDCGFPGD